MAILDVFRRDMYIRAKRDGTVSSVQTGIVTTDERSGGGVHTVKYDGLRATLVQPGQQVSKGQPLGKR